LNPCVRLATTTHTKANAIAICKCLTAFSSSDERKHVRYNLNPVI